jgi:hypothetical protein
MLVLAVLVSWFGTSALLANVTISSASGAGVPGGTVTVDITMTAATGDSPASLQWTTSVSAGDITGMTFAAGAASTAAGKSVSCGSGTTTVTCLVFGINQTVIGNGVVATVTLNISPSTLSTSTPLTLSQGAASNVSGASIPTTTVGSTIAIAQPPRPSSVSCNPSTVTTPGSSNCTVTLNQTSGAGGTAVGLSSNNANLTVPVSVTVAAGFISANFTANAAQVSSTQSATITASANGGVAQTSPALTLNPPANQSITVTSNPAGLQIIVDGTTYTSPQTFQWVAGSSHSIGVNSPQTSTGVRRTYTSWSDGGAQTHNITTPSTAATYTANFQTSYLLTTAVSPSGSGSVQVSPSSGDGYYVSGTSITLTPSPATGYQFSSWTGSPGSSTASPLVFSITAPQTITANFANGNQSITVTTNPVGLQIIVDGTTYTSPQTFQWAPNSSHSIGVNSPQTSSGVRHTYTSWSDGGAQTHNITTPSTAATYTANFQISYLLTTAVSPAGTGSVQVSPSSGDGYYAPGTWVSLTPVPATGYRFSNWTGTVGSSTASPLTFSMNAAHSITGNFVVDTPGTQSITVTTNPAGLQIVVDGVTQISPQTFQWSPGSSHSIGVNSPQTSAGVRNTFTSWSDGGAQTHNITTPSSATTYTASFQTSYLLSTGVSPAGTGTVQASPPSGDGYYASGTTVQLTPVPATGFQFSNWTGDLGNSTASPLVFPMTAPRSVTGNFTSATSSCTPALSRNTFATSPDGDLLRLDVTVGQGCNWNTVNSESWITVLEGFSGSGSGRVRFSVAANPTSQIRTGIITVGGVPVTIHQANSGCTGPFSVTPTTLQFGGGGGELGSAVNSLSTCLWPVATAPGWLTVREGTGAGSGGGIKTLQAPSNTSGLPRAGSFTVAGMTVTMLQEAMGSTVFFSDVPAGHPQANYIALLRLNNVTSGCSATEYCPDATTTRGQMAAFIIRSLMKGDVFPYPPAPYFSDVPPSHPFFPHIQKMRELGITNGCSATEYCPDAFVTRGQMSVFLVRARLGISSEAGLPYPGTPFFGDVAPSHPFYVNIQKLRQMGITVGCTVSEYCPDQPTTRAQMAAFLIRAFFTP